VISGRSSKSTLRVRLLEENLTKTKPGYEDYVARTNAFFPWFRD